MATPARPVLLCFQLLLIYNVAVQCQFNPTILQDSRLEPDPDGTFGFAYRTEDGIRATAQGDPSGVIQGSYSYTDPTGLKVNINYHAGSRQAPGHAPTQQQQPQQHQQPQQQAQQQSQSQPDYYRPGPQPSQAQYRPGPAEPPRQQEYRPRTRPPAAYAQPEYAPPPPPRRYSPNDIEDDYRYGR